MTDTIARVVKVGGSLFDLPDLPRVLTTWLARQSPAEHVLVAGGGPMAESVRQADQRFRLDASAAHWTCIGVLTATARLVAAILPQASLISRFDRLRGALRRGGRRVMVFEVEDFLRNEESDSPGSALPRDWRVTSDSIAARLALAIGAQELILLKSTGLPRDATKSSAAAMGLVDEYSPVAAQCLPAVRWVNLRDAQAAEARLP